ncbi:MAG: hypothetical protein AAB543_00675 [Pseudomonadota bacterium]
MPKSMLGNLRAALPIAMSAFDPKARATSPAVVGRIFRGTD